jgi:protein subunit release factor A
MSDKKLLFSITKNDFEWQTFRAGGKGGQNQNKVESGVRCIHPPSGARGEARDSRDQLRNRRAAFERCVNSETFKAWHRVEVARRLGKLKGVEQKVEEAMSLENLRIEFTDKVS